MGMTTITTERDLPPRWVLAPLAMILLPVMLAVAILSWLFVLLKPEKRNN